MASSVPTFPGVPRLTSRRKALRPLRVRAQISGTGDEGKPSISVVDANMGVLRERMEMARMEERLEKWRASRSIHGGGLGWNYSSGHDTKLTRRDGQRALSEFLEVAELVFGTFGFTILCSTLCLCLVSFLLHHG